MENNMCFKKLTFFILTLTLSSTAFAELSLNDLSFKQDDLKVDQAMTHTLEIRQSKLQTHQKLGLATMGMMTATLLSAEGAKKNDLHKFLGIGTGLMYWTTAYFSLSAPEVQGAKENGSTNIHRTLAWIHAPLMAIVPVLGLIHKNNDNHHRESKGIVEAHGALATIAYAAFMSAGAVMYFDF
jgi:hypothetical protein